MKRLKLLVVGLAAVFMFMPSIAHADVNDFTITDFSADYYLKQDDPQGTLDITERISVAFTDENHGIERAIPKKYEGQNQHIKIIKVQRDGNTEPYTTYGSNGNEVLRIGDANQTITGAHVYTIDYRVVNVIKFTDNTDQLIWNTTGTEWRQPFYAVSARLHLPSNLVGKFSDAACFTGSYKSEARNCTVNQNGAEILYETNGSLAAGETMTFAGSFPVGTFTKPGLKDWWQEYGARLLQITLPPVIAFIVVYRYWRKHGKDLKGRGTIVPEYTPPDALRAAEADTINNFKPGTNAISATIIDLAIRKHLRVIESETNGILGFGKGKEYSFQKLPVPPNDVLKPYENKILDGLFASGDIVKASGLRNQFYKTAEAVQKDIPDSLTQAGYFPRNPRKAGVALAVIASVLFFSIMFYFWIDWPLAVGVVISAIIVGFFSFLMPNRTQKGAAAKDALAGLKLYMETAEKDRIAMLQSPNAPYAAKTDAPQQTVELFEKLLPYAMIMGVEKEWAKQFERIYTTPPDWYNGNWAAFNTAYLVSSLNDSVGAMNSSFAAPASSGSGSGGGFSGGGGGGGGGGGW
ncbi:DUF2207 domain-containing protein [Candidatus Saccharibacteria bacterium]|nr:MAG: DUF2207 domain-containing protein [Candidatus Saccharibacteria bacterium]